MGTPQAFNRIQNFGNTKTAYGRYQHSGGRVLGEFRELSMAARAREIVYQFSTRRVEQMERSEHQTIQGTEKTSQELSTSNHFNGNPNTAGAAGFMGASRDLGLRSAAGIEPHKIQRNVLESRSNESTNTCYIQLED